MNLRKEGGFTIKVQKYISSQFKPVGNNYVAIMHQPVTVSSNVYPNACTNKEAFAGVIAYVFYTSQSRD